MNMYTLKRMCVCVSRANIRNKPFIYKLYEYRSPYIKQKLEGKKGHRYHRNVYIIDENKTKGNLQSINVWVEQ